MQINEKKTKTMIFNFTEKYRFGTILSMGNGALSHPFQLDVGKTLKSEIYGECDETISRNAKLLPFATRFVTPLLCLVGIIVCMVKICWHVMITTNTTRTTRLGNLRGQHHDVTQQTHRDEG